MRNIKLIVVAALVALANAGFAQTEPQVGVTSAPGKVSVTGTIKTTSTIVGIEPGTRTVWLKDAKGKIVQLVVGDEARNFDQLKIGDVVTAEYSQALTVMLRKDDSPLSTKENSSLERTPLGAKPGGTATREVTVIANVTAVNTHTGVITLKGPQGNSLDLIVQDPDQLKHIKKGDRMEVVYNEAIAISVEPQASK
ncbi:hypothetical protein [Paraburkholderia domus]|uniref:Copper-binding protein n=1 Tax=Paraburkholderia domus TaxID=2793075 RepID=A0A9N8MLZ0_9BURK|nr:hypothetical protein [Paraburkholderia domus]MBK5049281.1 hypothetical protein [Burkholderia sp. R-70006]MBK5060250.1 hypothetical protein [Burkholderia sp. R-70199]MBK5085118.1 hypothetical protein [Burkholderia sp. R-69927]MBK5118514.1 hypothetical protein [Burkholderia sp. R-69980]MBK5164352.1 hypothetical protein [Burkholderia sp. R-70211]MBK5179611.1 hypothetical protein [Burkholderia sp. R-69749]